MPVSKTKAIDAEVVTLPGADFVEKTREYINEYKNTVHSELNGKTPAQLWQTLENFPMVLSLAELVLPVESRIVKRGGIKHQNRLYRNDELIHFEDKKVQIQFDMHNDSAVEILNMKGQWICTAKLNSKRAYLSDSRIEEAKQKRLANQLKLIDNKRLEKEKRAMITLGVEPDLKHLDILNQPALKNTKTLSADDTDNQATSNTPDSSIVIDITDTSWADED